MNVSASTMNAAIVKNGREAKISFLDHMVTVLSAQRSEARRHYFDTVLEILTASEKLAGKISSIIKAVAVRVKRAARSVGSAVRQTFAARKAAKAADSGGGSSDPDGRRPLKETNTRNTFSAVSAFLFGGAK